MTEEFGGDRVEVVAAAQNSANDGHPAARLRHRLRKHRLARARLAKDEDGRVPVQGGLELASDGAQTWRREQVGQGRRAAHIHAMRARFAQKSALRLRATVLLEDRADENRGRHEELNVALFDELSGIAEVDIENTAQPPVGAPRRKRCGKRHDDAEERDARCRAGRSERIGEDASPRIQRLPDDGLADLFALRGREGLLVAARVDRAGGALRIGQEDESAVRAEKVDHDIQAVVHDGVAVEDAEESIEEPAHVAPHRLVVERRLGGERIPRLCHPAAPRRRMSTIRAMSTSSTGSFFMKSRT